MLAGRRWRLVRVSPDFPFPRLVCRWRWGSWRWFFLDCRDISSSEFLWTVITSLSKRSFFFSRENSGSRNCGGRKNSSGFFSNKSRGRDMSRCGGSTSKSCFDSKLEFKFCLRGDFLVFFTRSGSLCACSG